MGTPAFVGVDNGGTWIRLVGINKKGRRVWSLKKRSPTIPNLPAFLRHHLKRFRGKLEGLAVGSRAIWKKAARRSLKHQLHGLAKHIVVMSDVEGAWMAAFGNFCAPCTVHRDPMQSSQQRSTEHGARSTGIIVISGTGSIAYGRTATGRFARAGGLGPKIGDEGSGYWIGKKWLEGRGERGERRQSVRQIAAKAPSVIRKAKFGNPMANRIIQEAQAHLTRLVLQTAKSLHCKKNVPFAVSGSVFRNAWFKRGFIKQVKKKNVRAQFVPSKTDAAHALAVFLLPSPLPPQRS